MLATFSTLPKLKNYKYIIYDIFISQIISINYLKAGIKSLGICDSIFKSSPLDGLKKEIDLEYFFNRSDTLQRASEHIRSN